MIRPASKPKRHAVNIVPATESDLNPPRAAHYYSTVTFPRERARARARQENHSSCESERLFWQLSDDGGGRPGSGDTIHFPLSFSLALSLFTCPSRARAPALFPTSRADHPDAPHRSRAIRKPLALALARASSVGSSLPHNRPSLIRRARGERGRATCPHVHQRLAALNPLTADVADVAACEPAEWDDRAGFSIARVRMHSAPLRGRSWRGDLDDLRDDKDGRNVAVPRSNSFFLSFLRTRSESIPASCDYRMEVIGKSRSVNMGVALSGHYLRFRMISGDSIFSSMILNVT